MNWYLEVLKKYAVFSGRARRKEYWMFFLFNLIIATILGAILGIVGAIIDQPGIVAIGHLYSLAILIPSFSSFIRRLHDTGRSGWFLLLSLIPVIGSIILIVFVIQEGQSGPNQYGEDPKAA